MEKDTNLNLNYGITGEKIDLVIPMVFPTDREWLNCFERYHRGDARKNVRFRSWNNEELLIQCCKRYMPWLNHIYILLARESQIQPWMNNYEGVSVVMHRDFIPQQYLPCFSSPCIEMFIGRIPGLAEKFIYSNDDVFPLSALLPTDFFRNGKACVRIRSKAVPQNPNLYEKACLHQQRMIALPFGKADDGKYLRSGHSMAPLFRSVCKTVWEQHNEEIRRNLCPLRRTEYSYNQYIYLLYEYYSGMTTDYVPHSKYAGPGTPTDELATIITTPGIGIVCLNDNENIADWQHRADVVRDAIVKNLSRS